MDTPAAISCPDLRDLIAQESDPARKAALEAEYAERCGAATQGGGGGTTNPPEPGGPKPR